MPHVSGLLPGVMAQEPGRHSQLLPSTNAGALQLGVSAVVPACFVSCSSDIRRHCLAPSMPQVGFQCTYNPGTSQYYTGSCAPESHMLAGR